jgi:hypothetical protein
MNWLSYLFVYLFILFSPNFFRLILGQRYPKYSGLVSQSIQQLWERKAPVDGRITMSIESLCQVSRSWVDVGSLHMHLVVRFMTCTASVRIIWIELSTFNATVGRVALSV